MVKIYVTLHDESAFQLKMGGMNSLKKFVLSNKLYKFY